MGGRRAGGTEVAREFKRERGRTIANAVVGAMVRAGVGPSRLHLLTTVGRRTGRPRTHPVSVYALDGERWLVSPYGERPWVRNVRASGEAVLRRGRRRERIALEEVGAERAAPVLREYIRGESIVRPYFDVEPDAPLDAFEAEAPRHPVFRIETRGEAG